MLLSALPNETLAHIISYLRTVDLKVVAQTYNKKITSICLPALADWRALVRNDKKMIASFGRPNPWDPNRSCFDLITTFKDQFGKYSLPSKKPIKRLQALEYLGLDGDLYWLQSLDANTAKSMSYYHGESPEVSPDQVAALKKSCTKLGLTLPKGFEKFMTSLELQHRIPSSSACYWTCEPLAKLKSIRKENLDGYVSKIYSDQQDCWYWHLYMDRDGGHCILSNPYDFRRYYEHRGDTDSEDDLDNEDSRNDDDIIKRISDENEEDANETNIIEDEQHNCEEDVHDRNGEDTISADRGDESGVDSDYSGDEDSGNITDEIRDTSSESEEDNVDRSGDTFRSKEYRQQWTDELTAVERELGITVSVAEDFDSGILHSTNFEEFLVRTYFEEWAFFYEHQSSDESTDLPLTLKEYLSRVYTTPAKDGD